MTAATHLIRKGPTGKKKRPSGPVFGPKGRHCPLTLKRTVDQDPFVLLAISTMRHAYRTLLQDCQGKFLRAGLGPSLSPLFRPMLHCPPKLCSVLRSKMRAGYRGG